MDTPLSPSLVSLAFRDIAVPDWAAVTVVPLPANLPLDPEMWAREIFDIARSPRWVVALMALRTAAVTVVGIDRASAEAFAVDRVEGGEACLFTESGHLDFSAGVAADPDARLLRVTTVVRLKGVRGRLYFLPIRLLHDPITRSMMGAAVRRVTARVA